MRVLVGCECSQTVTAAFRETFPGIAAVMAEQWGCLDLVGHRPSFFF